MASHSSSFRRPQRAVKTSRKSLARQLFVEQLESRETPATLAAGFTENLVANGLTKPTAMEFSPDGRLFVAEETGALRVIKGGTLLPTPFVTLDVDSSGERGLLGVAFDPQFASNHFIYLYYTAKTPTIHNRVSRFTANGDTVVANSEVPLIDLNTLNATVHNGGSIHFGIDGKLYIGVGENGQGSNAQSLQTLLGKFLRINSDGSIPSDNPFFSTATGTNRAIWALGLRNPFTFAVQPGTGRIFINDVGASSFEEIDDGNAGANYGWPITEGPTTDQRFQAPLYSYSHGSGDLQGNAITGGTFYNPAVNQFPSDYAGKYFFADLINGWIHRLEPTTGTVTDFATGINLPVDLDVDSAGNLYYLSHGDGAVFRIQFTQPQATDQTRFVAGLYRDVLGRAGESSGVLSFQQALDASRQPVFQALAGSFLTSNEYRTRLAGGFYQTYLGRTGGSAEIAQQVSQFQQGQSTEQVASVFLGSDEYFQRNGPTNTAWLKAAYNAVLGRDPDPNGQSVYLQQLGSSVTRQAVALSLLLSSEYRGRLVGSFYQTYLGRAGSATDVAFWVNKLQQGQTDEQVQAAFVSSAEYLQRFQTSGQPWLTSLFQGFLGRQPDTAGFTSLTNALLDGYATARRSVAAAFVTSTEARAREIAGLYSGLLGRTGSGSEIAPWVNQRQQGATAEQIQSIFLGSAEYFQLHGPNNSDWLRAVYNATLGRDPDTQAQAFFLNQLSTGTSRQLVALTLLNSDEYRTRLVAGFYQTYLGRAGAGADVAAFVALLRQGRTQEQVQVEFLASNEYFLRQ